MTVTGTVRVDLTDVPRDRQRHRLHAVTCAPTGCRVVLIVGALAAEPETVRLVREHAGRLHIDVHGQPHAVQMWLDALRSGDLLPLRGAG